MKRRVAIVLILLLAGAVVNVAVAWAAWGKTGYSLLPVGRITFRQPPTDQIDIELWGRHATDSWPQAGGVNRFDGHTFGARYRHLHHQVLFSGFVRYGDPDLREFMLNCGIYQVIMVHVGWPASCLTLDAWRWEPDYAEGPDGWPVRVNTNAAHEHDGLLLFGKPMPRHPLWPGFAINTLLYATVLWLLIPGPFVLRRYVRQRRGLCQGCGYPVGESAVCSECGRELPNCAGEVA